MNIKTIAALAASVIATTAWAGEKDAKCGAGACGKKETSGKEHSCGKKDEAGKEVQEVLLDIQPLSKKEGKAKPEEATAG